MTRTIISIPEDMKVWLDNYSKTNKKPTAETIREALKEYKVKIENESKIDLLSQTSGLWKEKNIDGLEYVKSLRSEW
ncbi:MAG: hypothetical protein V3V16_10835 [Melioribacteraceae bacterium]